MDSPGLGTVRSEVIEHMKSREIPFFRNTAGATLCTLGIGGPLELLCVPNSLHQVTAALEISVEHCLSTRILGGGSNVLIPDEGLPGLTIQLGKAFAGFCLLGPVGADYGRSDTIKDCLHNGTCAPLKQLQAELQGIRASMGEGTEVEILVPGSTPLMSLSRQTVLAGFSGLEFAAGIPASLGGAIRMNAGAHGGQMSDVVTEVFSVSAEHGLRQFSTETLGFAYRQCSLPAEELVLASVLRLKADDVEVIKQRRTSCLSYRKKTQPLSLPSAGSVFRNPVQAPTGSGDEVPTAAELLDRLGVKSWVLGGVRFSEMHANWIVRTAEVAKASDVRELIKRAQAEAESAYDVRLQSEILLW